MSTHPSNQRWKINKHYSTVNAGKKRSSLLFHWTCYCHRLGFTSSFFFLCVFFFLLVSGFVSPSTSRTPSANMAHSSTYGRTVPERSRSRDDPMWHSHHSQQRGRRYDPRPEVPPAPRLRKVLAIVDLQSVRPLMNKTHDDVMDATTCDASPSLSRVEERALFTYNVLLNTHRLESFTVYNLLYASASTSGTPGITTCPRLPWTSDGKTKLETPLLSATKTDWLIFFMIFVLIGLKAKNWAFYFPMIFDLLRLTFSLISCA